MNALGGMQVKYFFEAHPAVLDVCIALIRAAIKERPLPAAGLPLSAAIAAAATPSTTAPAVPGDVAGLAAAEAALAAEDDDAEDDEDPTVAPGSTPL